MRAGMLYAAARMANVWYPEGLEDVVDGTIDPDTDDLRVVAVSSSYTYSAAHTTLADVGAGTRIATLGSALTTSVISINSGAGRALDVADFSFPSVASGSTIDALVVYRHNATESLALLLCYIDTDASGNPISVATNGNNVNITIPATGLITFNG